MRILLTNDDGIDSPGIQLLAAALRKAGHRVFVLAPSSDRSGFSHYISFLGNPCKMVHVDEDTWSCGGTPADCVVIAVLGGMPELAAAEKLTETNHRNTSSLDLVISGINRGSNTGTDIVFSGTAAGARQGAFYNIPSLALSLAKGDGPSRDEWHWDMAVDFTVMRLNEMMAYWKPGSFVNVNIPNKKDMPTALVHAFPSLRYYDDYVDTYKVSDKIRYCFVKLGDYEKKPEKGSDREVIAENKVSVSVICIHPVLLESVKGEGGV